MRFSFRRATHTFRSATYVAKARPAYAGGIRASIATILPLALGEYSGNPAAGSWMSLGGFNGSLSDRGGSYRTRALTMFAVMGVSAVAVALGTLASRSFLAAIVLTFVVAFSASLLRVFGNAGISVSGSTLSAYVVALAIAPESGTEWLMRSGFLVAGGIFATLLAIFLWPLQPYRPARLAVAQCYRALASYIEEAAAGAQAPNTAEWPIHHEPTAITNVRAALEDAREVLVVLRRGKPGSAERGERLLVLSESADQMYGHLVALADALAGIPERLRVESLHELCIATMREIAGTCRAIAAGIEKESQADPIPVKWSGDQVRAALDGLSAEAHAHYEQASLIMDRAAQFALSASVSVESLNGGEPDVDALAALDAPNAEGRLDVIPFFEQLRALLTPGSLITRFAFRVAVVTTVAAALTSLLDLKRGYWVTLTVVVILQPYTGVTLTRALQRVLGTVLGGLLAAGLGALFHDPRAILVIAALFVFCCVALLPVNYAAFSVFLTPTFVLLAEASAGEWNLAETRVLNTLLGGALALLGSRILWPSPEHTRFPQYGAAMVRATRNYLDAVVHGFDDDGRESGEAMRAARRSVGLAAANAEDSLQRSLTEVHGDRRRIAPSLSLLAYARRFTATVAALAIARHSSPTPNKGQLRSFHEWATQALAELSDALEANRIPAPLKLLPEQLRPKDNPLLRARIDRLARQIETLHDAASRMNGATDSYSR